MFDDVLFSAKLETASLSSKRSKVSQLTVKTTSRIGSRRSAENAMETEDDVPIGRVAKNKILKYL